MGDALGVVVGLRAALAESRDEAFSHDRDLEHAQHEVQLGQAGLSSCG